MTAFIRGLLENVGPEIDPVLLIRRIKNGLEIPGLKEALIKILQDFQLQMSLLDGCQTILNGDSASFTKRLQKDQTSGFFLTCKALLLAQKLGLSLTLSTSEKSLSHLYAIVARSTPTTHSALPLSACGTRALRARR